MRVVTSYYHFMVSTRRRAQTTDASFGPSSADASFGPSSGDAAFGPTSEAPVEAPDAGDNIRTLVAASLGALAFIILLLYILRRKGFTIIGKNPETKKIRAFLSNHDLPLPRQHSYLEIKRMTKWFRDQIGQGGFGSVYKGTLPNGRLVAVKVLNDSKSNGEDFINEVSSISRTSHVNVVSLLGFCYDPKRVLIYEYMQNGSLDKLIYNQGPNVGQITGWKMMYEIAIGIARGLEYLHQGCNTRILHFDIKPHNILLDGKFCSKISDFGLAKLGKNDQSNVSTLVSPRGTLGYIAPEVCSSHFGRVSYKSDVYSYGMMVLEMVGRRKNVDPLASKTSKIYFPYYVYKHIEAGQDLDLDDINDEDEKEIAQKMVLVGLWCIQTNPPDRPSMTGVLEMLEGKLESILLPPKPFACSPTASP